MGVGRNRATCEILLIFVTSYLPVKNNKGAIGNFCHP